jgi:hypothetical protein
VVVRGCGGGGGGGSAASTAAVTVAVGGGGNSGVSLEAEINPGGLIPSGTFTVGAGGAGSTGAASGVTGGTSTLTIGTTTLMAPGGIGGQSGAAVTVPPTSSEGIIAATNAQTLFASSIGPTPLSYQACDQGSPGIAVNNTGIGSGYTGGQGGNGGSGRFGIGGAGGNFEPVVAANGLGNGAGGGGAASPIGTPVTSAGANGAPGIWIIEEYS